jgi:hypothetical protein
VRNGGPIGEYAGHEHVRQCRNRRPGAQHAAILGQVLFLVAVAMGFAVAGTFMGRELSEGAARACSFAGLGMLIVTWFVDAVRRGPLGIAGCAACRC